MTAADMVLVESLRLAVPLRMLELEAMNHATRAATVPQWARDAVEPVASRGDALQFGGRKGQAAEVFNALARGLAALAHCPGGVLFAGTHWCVVHSYGVAVDSSADLMCDPPSAEFPVVYPPLSAWAAVETVAVDPSVL